MAKFKEQTRPTSDNVERASLRKSLSVKVREGRVTQTQASSRDWMRSPGETANRDKKKLRDGLLEKPKSRL